MTEVLEDTLGATWVRPSDYAEAVKSLGRELSTPRNLGKYQRQIERDVAVQHTINKLGLLGN